MTMVSAPKLLERTCDAGKSNMEAGELLKYTVSLVEQHGEKFMLSNPHFPGCGTRFQWFWGMNCCCPECGRTYISKIDDLKSGKYQIQGEVNRRGQLIKHRIERGHYGPRKYWTEADIDRLKELASQQKTNREIAIALDRGDRSVTEARLKLGIRLDNTTGKGTGRQVGRKRGIKVRKKVESEEFVEKLLRLAEK
jgi:hypothetical protein